MHFKDFFNIFTKKQDYSKGKKLKITHRNFLAAKNSRFTNWLYGTLAKITFDTRNDLKTLINRSRELSKNSSVIRSYLNVMEKNIIGKSGFTLQCQVKSKENILDKEVNDLVEWMWYNWSSDGCLTMDGEMSHADFDTLILRNLIVDGEVFIRIHRNTKTKYGLAFSIIDPVSINTSLNRPKRGNENMIVCGVEVDDYFKPIQYHLMKGTDISYYGNTSYTLPAKDVIHIFKKEYIGQTRGFPFVAACLTELKQIEDYTQAELFSAKVAACMNLFYERTSNSSSDDLLDSETAPENGEFISELSPGESSIVPDGYTVKSVASNHPNNGFESFTKALLMRISSSLGISYNKLCKDYGSVNYSSLREASLDEASFFQTMQRLIIEQWKNKEYKLFIEAIKNNVSLSTADILSLNSYFTFIGVKRAYFDKAKDLLADEKALVLGLTNPIKLLQEEGIDPEENIKQFVLWKNLCQQYDISFAENLPTNSELEKPNEEAEKSDEDMMNSRD